MKSKSNSNSHESVKSGDCGEIPVLLTSKEVAAKFRVSTKTLGEWRRKKLGPQPIQISGTYRYLQADVLAFIETAKEVGTEPRQTGETGNLKTKTGSKGKRGAKTEPKRTSGSNREEKQKTVLNGNERFRRVKKVKVRRKKAVNHTN